MKKGIGYFRIRNLCLLALLGLSTLVLPMGAAFAGTICAPRLLTLQERSTTGIALVNTGVADEGVTFRLVTATGETVATVP